MVLHSRSPVPTWVAWSARVLPLKQRSERSSAFQRLRSPTCGPSILTMRKTCPRDTRTRRRRVQARTLSTDFDLGERMATDADTTLAAAPAYDASFAPTRRTAKTR